MKDQDILDLLKKSKAFNERLSKETQESIIQRIPAMTSAKKLKLVEVLVREQEALQEVAESQKKILESFADSLARVIRETVSGTKARIEEEEELKALKELETSLKNV